MNYCPACGHEVNEQSEFCTECGASTWRIISLLYPIHVPSPIHL
ncbi:zinc ribbon domain-containing protein [Pontibacillus salicampi]|uniref:Zinc ribbon domain-containing protein n=1 Tax=Pontibacillus salicampi TaxID=1449801 RepID=A0ABV6LSC8_9BACI